MSHRPITPNEYQKSDQKTRVRQHFNQLSSFLDESTRKNDAHHGHDFVVYSLTTTRPDEEQKPVALAATPDEKILTDQNQSGRANKSTQANKSLILSEDVHRANGPLETVDDNKSSCVDLKGMAKLKRLCCMLRKKVTGLKRTYEKSHRLGYTYTESERADLDSGLRSLENGTIQLLQMLDNIDGYSKEMKHVINVYTDYESLYRKLRSVNKNARSRVKTEKAESVDDTDFSFWTTLKDFVLCSACFNL